MAKKETAEEKCRKYSRSQMFQGILGTLFTVIAIFLPAEGFPEWIRYIMIVVFILYAIISFRNARRDEYYYLVRKIEENEKNKEAAKIKRLKNNAAILAEKQKANEK